MNETLLNKARLNVVSLNKALINGAVERHGSSAGGGGAPSKYIRFADPAVEAVLMANGVSSDGVGITKEDAAAVTNIGTWFRGNTAIQSFDELKYFTGVTDIKDGAFNSCTSLASINLDNVTIIRASAFYGCSALNQYMHIPQVTMLGNQSFRNSGIVGADISGVQVLTGGYNGGAFGACSSLKEVIFSPYLTDIQQFSFINCTALESAYIPASVTAIGRQAFYGCTSLAFEELNLSNLTSLDQNAFYGVKIKKLNLCKLISLPSAGANTAHYGDKATLEEIILSNDITSIPDYSFYAYNALAKVSMNYEAITSIGTYSFRETAYAGSINFPNLTTIEYHAFVRSKVKSVDNLGRIDVLRGGGIYSGPFNYCTDLEFVRIPKTLTSIESYQFAGCTSLKTIVVEAVNPPTLASNFLHGLSWQNNITIYVPDAALEVYKTATNWSAYADRIHPLSELEGSPYITFADAEVERVLMENNVSSDGVGITMADAQAVTSIGTWFKGNRAITSFEEFVYFNGVTELVKDAFLDSSLASISLPNSLKTLNAGVFGRCYNLEGDFIIPQVKALNRAAFLATAINSVYAPNVVTMTGANSEGVFRLCVALTRVTLGKVANIPRECFAECSKLSEVEIEWDNVTEIAQDAFIRCTSLPSLDIGGNVTSIGGGAFYGCSSLQLLICRATTPPSLANANAFTDTNNCPVYVPDASVDAYKAAENWSQYQARIKPLSEYVES